MADLKFKHYCRYHNGTDWVYYYVNAAGAVTSTTTKTAITYSPEGWLEGMVDWERGLTFWGILRNYSGPVKAVKDVAKILRHLYVLYGSNANLSFYIELLDNSVSTYGYNKKYSGDFDFINYVDEDKYVTITIMESGFPAYLKARQSVNYKTDVVHNANVIWVRLHPCMLQYYAKWLGSEGEVLQYDLLGNKFPTMSIWKWEGTNLTVPVYSTSGNSFIKIIENTSDDVQTFDLEHHYDYDAENPNVLGAVNGSFQYGYFLYDSTNTFISETVLFSAGVPLAVGTSGTYTGDTSGSISLNPGEYLAIFTRLKQAGPGNVFSAIITQRKSTLSFDIKYPTEERYFPCIKPIEVYNTLIDGITDGETTAESELLDANEDKLLTCGDGLRNLETSEITTNIDDFYKSVFGVLGGCALTYDRVNSIAKLIGIAETFDMATNVDIGEVASMKTSTFKDILFSRLKVGFPNFVYDNVNGKDESNIMYEYLSGSIRTQQEKDLMSVYRGDMMGVLLTALNLLGKKSTDNDSDNDIFWVHADLSAVAGQVPFGFQGEGQDYYDLYRDNTLTITNRFDEDNVFNIFFSPKRCALRLGAFLRSALFGIESMDLKLQASSKTTSAGTKMVTDDGVTIIDEGTDIIVTDLDDPLFVPMVVEVECLSPLNLSDLMDDYENQYVEYTYKGNSYGGFILKCRMDLAIPKKQVFTLLLTTTSDLSNMVV